MRPNVRIYSHTEFARQVLKITLFSATHTHYPHMAALGVYGPVFNYKYSEQQRQAKDETTAILMSE